MSPSRWRRAAVALLAGLLLVLLPAGASGADDSPSVPPAGLPIFGPGLDWETDTAEDYRDRLGLAPSLYAQRIDYPLTDASDSALRRLVEQLAEQGAVALVSLQPTQPLEDLDEADAEGLAARLDSLTDELGTTFLVRFAPEMNGTWYPWGQQPDAYVSAFRTLADALHVGAPGARTVWSPVYGAGYPYGAAYGDVDPDRRRGTDALDTDGNGRLDGGDDPYGPYWPGPDAVDWVGLTLYHFGVDRGRDDNDLDPSQGGERGEQERSIGFETDVAPDPGAFRDRLEERFGYEGGAGRRSFYDRFAARHDLPMLVETGAVWLPDPEGDPELDIKRSWWRQVLRADDDYPLLRGISWLEQRRPEAEVGGRTVDWRATRSEDLALALATDLEGEVTLGPVTEVPETGSEPEGTGDVAVGAQGAPTAGGIVIAAWALAALLLVALLARALRPAWSWRSVPGVPGAATARDQRLDALRGLLLLLLVLAHLEVVAGATGPATRLMGVTAGAEAFVLLSGVVLALGHAPLVARAGGLSAASRLWRRGAVLWFAAVATTVVVLLLSHVPGLRTRGVTTWVAPSGERTDLFADAAPLLDYPPPWPAVRELFVLSTGVWPLSILGLLVVLSLLSPPVLWLLRRGLWWLVLVVSWGAYAWGVLAHPDWTDGLYESAYPPLVWQVVFVHGLVLGHHHALVARVWTSRVGRVSLAVGVLTSAAAVTAVWAIGAGGDARLVDLWSGRDLPAGRLTSLLVVGVVSLAVVSACWGPLRASIARPLVLLGRAGLAVLVSQVLLLVLVDSVATAVGGAGLRSWWQLGAAWLVGTAAALLVSLLTRRTAAG